MFREKISRLDETLMERDYKTRISIKRKQPDNLPPKIEKTMENGSCLLDRFCVRCLPFLSKES